MSDTVPKSVPSVAVPPVPSMETVTSSSATCEIVAVNVMVDPEFSVIELAEDANVTVGELSFSEIVIVCVCGVLFSATPVFPVTPLSGINIVAVSSPS